MKIFQFVRLSCLALLLSVVGLGGGTTSVESGKGVSRGQALMDLDEAREQGLLTEKECERAKKDILKGK